MNTISEESRKSWHTLIEQHTVARRLGQRYENFPTIQERQSSITLQQTKLLIKCYLMDARQTNNSKYDTVNHRHFFAKVLEMNVDLNLTDVVHNIFNLRNRDAQREQHFTSNGTLYGNTSVSWCPPWQNICNTKQKVNARNNIIRKLASSNWGSRALTLRSTGLALCYSTAENTCVVWARSTQAKKLNHALHDCCRITTGCLKPTT